MSFEKTIQQLIAVEVEKALKPIRRQLAELSEGTAFSLKLARALGTASPVRVPPVRTGRPRGQDLGCAIIGCPSPHRSMGYCSSHYQKFRILARRGQLPPAWKEHAAPGSVSDFALPRGRAGAKALANLRKSQRQKKA